jgi:hypothetical protein
MPTKRIAANTAPSYKTVKSLVLTVVNHGFK